MDEEGDLGPVGGVELLEDGGDVGLDRGDAEEVAAGDLSVRQALYNGKDAGSDPWVALAWAVGITLVFSWLAVRKFTQSASR